MTGTTEIPNTNIPALEVLRWGFVRRRSGTHATDNIDMRSSARVTETEGAIGGGSKDQAGPGTPVLVHQISIRDEACRRVKQIVKSADRQAACEEGLGRFYDRYQPDPDDQIVK